VPHSRGLKKVDLWIEDFQLEGIRNVIVDVNSCHELHGSCVNPLHNGEPSHPDVNGILDASVKEKVDNYQHNYNARNCFFFRRHDDPRENQRGLFSLPPPALHTVPPSGREVLDTHWHP